ncbi:hypothetical protein [Paraflavitalea pollutisoli]|uniref:hypothetical protein n=1 Tax=Paraflavitalea pollutisoli TaxID=3034143 RepID=UPI0023EAEF9A|nr:hypothetical protein [Paraflavitalea sp. H1-2-19X]
MKVAKPTGKILFQEAQQFRQLWLWALLISGTLLPLVLTSVFAWRDPKVSALQSMGIMAIGIVVPGINFVIFWVTKLETVVTDEGLFYRWRPYFSKYTMLNWQEIDAVTVRRYPNLKYGYHTNREFGKVHNIDGNKGVQFELVNGKRVYIGTQKLTALQHALEQMKPVKVNRK